MRKPRFTAMPNEVVDVHLLELTGAELKVLLVLLRTTYGWHRDTHTISISDLAERTGMARGTCCDAIASLEGRGLVSKVLNTTDGGARMASTYEVTFEDETQEDSVRPTEQECSASRTDCVRPAELHIRNKEIVENKKEYTLPTLSENTNPETLIRLWGSTKGLKRLSPAERKHVLENWKWFEVSEEVLTEALIRFAQWYKTSTNHLRSPVALFMKDPASWATLRTVPKDNRWDSRLVHFRGLYESTGAPSIDDDWDQAMKFCGELTEEDWQKAFAQVVTVQGAYQKAPKNYFRTREFERAPRPAPKSKLEEMWDKI